MFVDVIPAIRATKGVDQFTYQTEATLDSIQVGQLVWIPWRASYVLGVVSGKDVAAPPSRVRVKSIKQVTPFVLPEGYMKWLYWFAEYYALPLSTTAKSTLPEILRNAVSQLPTASDLTNIPVDALNGWRVKKHDIPAIQAEVRELQTKFDAGYSSIAVLYHQPAQMAAVIQGLAKHAKRLIIITPEESDSYQLAKTIENLKPLVVDTTWNKRQQQAWLTALSEPMICIGTRRLSLLPLTTADAIIVVDPENHAHKQWDQQPRYHAWEAAKRQAMFSNTPLITFSQALPLMVSVDAEIHNPFEHEFENLRIIDMRGEAQLHERGHISVSILERLTTSRFSVLWINRKGDAHWLVCRQCGWLTNDFTVNNCAKCRSLDLQKRGFGVDTIIRYLREQFPNYTILDVTADSVIHEVYDSSKSTIIVGTQALMKRISWAAVEYTAVLSIDQQLTRPDFSAIETAYGYLVHLRNVSAQLDIQTSVPEHPLFRALASVYPAEWLESELGNRKVLQLPPFTDRIQAWPVDRPNEAQVFSDLSEVEAAFSNEKIIHIDRQC